MDFDARRGDFKAKEGATLIDLPAIRYQSSWMSSLVLDEAIGFAQHPDRSFGHDLSRVGQPGPEQLFSSMQIKTACTS